MFTWIILFIAAAVILTLDMQLNKLSHQIKDLKDDLGFYLSDKIKESEQSIINMIENIESD